ncbi:aminotransferase class I/II-fold pyridoxal phosphate-dependent enzyme [Stenotrophomonas sp. CFBP 13718]|uniref:aminotransferase class I/II-fold pyridoxal phosphate-dependent enzyme n=1 Tax=Stenotrophomonas sp. CFBP 13718 TaxID=2775304 RepID=UPI00177BA228|nr:aminotransferase class I/II-fold pyridoxal phosphate-dependent enzyme [Stenotrophomonas sp. CFBP 13718]MBD8696030.1 aminotransferase class I/II-fold pyridoxal phosphate-dependent enzyme [Stenotrophomonas sp. CFBP 13718]
MTGPILACNGSDGLGKLLRWHAACRAAPLGLDMTRGLPSREQTALSYPMLSLPGVAPFDSEDGQDWLNYGGQQGIPQLRALLAPLLLGVPPAQAAVGGNSSLAMMHGAIGLAWRIGLPGHAPWSAASEVRFLCPVPGYDRHFAICRDYGIAMVPVPMGADGPDMDQVEERAARDPLIRGMWCVPRHSNPCGAIYSEEVIRRLATMNTAAPDFTLFCDNAYAAHDFAPQASSLPGLYDACATAGHPDRPLLFASTSKMTIPGAGIAMLGGSAQRVHWWLSAQQRCTIGPDKVNQVRHLRFFVDAAGVARHMQQHGSLLQQRFERVQQVFAHRLSALQDVYWSRPSGGYFITLWVPPGCARRIVRLAAEAGVAITPAGTTHCSGIDSEDRCLRIAPSRLSPDHAAQAADIIAGCVLLACAERASGTSTHDTYAVKRAP